MTEEMTNQELQKSLTSILESFHSFCIKNELQYYISAGTCLGAYRHSGFIPWDDDIDVCMPRSDYNKFIDLYTRISPQNRYKLKCLETNTSPYPFAKLEDSYTKITNSNSSLHQSLWIDIFPVDGINTQNLGSLSKNIKKIRFYGKMLEYACIEKPKGKLIVKTLKTVIIYIAKIWGAYYWGKKIRNIASRYNYDDYENIANLTWGYGLKEIIHKSLIFPLIDVPFENITVKAPYCDTYLKNLYGDYMKLPPVEKRVNHHIKAVLLDKKHNG